MDAGIYIAGSLNSENLEEVASSVTQVATASPFETVNVKALELFEYLSRPAHVAISDVNINGSDQSNEIREFLRLADYLESNDGITWETAFKRLKVEIKNTALRLPLEPTSTERG